MGVYKVDIVNDIEIEIKAKNLTDLFDTLIKSFSYIVAKGKITEDIKKDVVLKPDFPDVVVDFFNELIYLFETEKFIPYSVVSFKKDEEIFITISGSKYDSKKNKVKRILKSATYHNLEFKKDGEFYIKMIVDI